MSRFNLAFILVSFTALGGSSMAALSCQYGDVGGMPSASFVRTQANAQDWYGPYNEVQFCIAAGGTGYYVLIQEELVHGFKVTNPPRKVLTVKTLPGGETNYEVADDVDHVSLELSADKNTLKVTAQRFGEPVSATLQKEPSKN